MTLNVALTTVLRTKVLHCYNGGNTRDIKHRHFVFVTLLDIGKLEYKYAIFPPKEGRGLGHVTPEIFGIRLNISSKLLELETSSLVHSFVWEKPCGRSNNTYLYIQIYQSYKLQIWYITRLAKSKLALK